MFEAKNFINSIILILINSSLFFIFFHFYFTFSFSIYSLIPHLLIYLLRLRMALVKLEDWLGLSIIFIHRDRHHNRCPIHLVDLAIDGIIKTIRIGIDVGNQLIGNWKLTIEWHLNIRNIWRKRKYLLESSRTWLIICKRVWSSWWRRWDSMINSSKFVVLFDWVHLFLANNLVKFI